MLPAAVSSPVDFFTRARFEPVAVVVLLATAVAYLWAARRADGRGGRWPAWRTAAFLTGQVAVAVAVLSGLTSFDASNFSAYVSQYVLVALVAPFCYVLSAPLELVLRASRPRRADGVLRWLGRPTGVVLTHPVLAWLLYSGSLMILYFTGLFGATVADSAVQQLVFLVLVAVGILFYVPVVGARPLRLMGYWHRILYLLLTFPVWAILGMGLESQTTLIAPGISLGSLHLGAAVLWVAGETVALVGAIAVLWLWLRDDERNARHQDALNQASAARQLALWRASRDAAARAS